jgi:hypothetical protein
MNGIKNKNILKKTGLLFGRYEFRLFLFFLSLLMISWPFMTTAEDKSLYFPFFYFFSVWFVLVALSMVLNIGRKGEDNSKKDD